MFIQRANTLGTGITRDLLGQYSYFFVRILLLMLTFLSSCLLAKLVLMERLVWFGFQLIGIVKPGNLHHSLRFR